MRKTRIIFETIPNLCNGVKREGVKASPGLASWLFCYVPLHNIRYGIVCFRLKNGLSRHFSGGSNLKATHLSSKMPRDGLEVVSLLLSFLIFSELKTVAFCLLALVNFLICL